MEINIHVDGRLIKKLSLRKLLTGRRAWYVVGALALVIPVVALAAPTQVPNTFHSGDVISSSQVNDNFTTLVTGVNALDARVTTIDTRVTNNDTQLTTINTQLTTINTQLTTINTQLTALDTRITSLEAKHPLPSSNGIFAYVGTAVGDGPIARTFNSLGGTNTVAGTGGNYTVTLGGIDCPGTGIALSQAAGANGINCRVNGDWATVGGNCRVFVGCFNTTGNFTTTPFSLVYAK